jgi:hypothetical protein
VKIILRSKDRAKWEVIEVGEIDLVAWLHIAEQLGPQDQAKKILMDSMKMK